MFSKKVDIIACMDGCLSQPIVSELYVIKLNSPILVYWIIDDWVFPMKTFNRAAQLLGKKCLFIQLPR